MKVARTIYHQQICIELTPDELFEAHKEFVTNWMRGIVEEQLEDSLMHYTEDELNDLTETAWGHYEDAYGTEYECVTKAVDDYIEEYEENLD